MRGAQWVAGLLLASPLVAAAADTPVASVDFRASAWVDVDASGKAHVAEMGHLTKIGDVPQLAPVADAIQERLRDRIESWQFIPATRDGVSVASRTNVYVVLEALDDGTGGLAIRLRSAGTGPKLEYDNRGGIAVAGDNAAEEGAVVVDVSYGEDGKVVSAVVHDSKTFEAGHFVKRASLDLRKGLVRAAKSWLFKPEQVAGTPVAGSGRVPIVFCFTAACSRAWHESGSADAEPHYASIAKLRSDVAGSAL